MELQPAYVLHTRRYGETSLIVELITPRLGRHAVLAKGALSPRRLPRGPFRAFQPLLMRWRGRGELPVVTDVEPSEAPLKLAGRSLFCGLYVNELVLRLCARDDPHSTLFPAYVACLSGLAGAGEDNRRLEPVLRRFELALLDELGSGLQLESDVHGEPLLPEKRYHYDLGRGAVPIEGKDGYAGATLLALGRGRFDDDTQRREARRLMRAVIDLHLGGDRLKSRELFRTGRKTT